MISTTYNRMTESRIALSHQLTSTPGTDLSSRQWRWTQIRLTATTISRKQLTILGRRVRSGSTVMAEVRLGTGTIE